MSTLEYNHSHDHINSISGDQLFELGLACSVSNNGTIDLIDAHKWFNIAAIKGKQEALYYRQEIARELNNEQIAQAQRDARKWLQSH